jgi:hypothetical protein
MHHTNLLRQNSTLRALDVGGADAAVGASLARSRLRSASVRKRAGVDMFMGTPMDLVAHDAVEDNAGARKMRRRD